MKKMILFALWVWTSANLIAQTPSASFTASDTVICAGDSISFTNTSTGSTNYIWKYNGVIFSVSQDASRIFSIPGIDTITLVAYNSVLTDSTQTLITVNGNPTVIATESNITCNGANDGQVATSVFGGISPFSYLWSDATTSQNISGLNPGNYYVTVNDSNGCADVDSATVTEPAQLVFAIANSSPSCNGQCNGTSIAISSGGITPYSYLWSDSLGQTTQNATGLCVGIYSVTVADVNNCQVDTTFVLSEPTALFVTISTTDASCGQSVGAATAGTSGGTTPYSFQWSNGTTDSIANGLTAGNYYATVTDANGCQILDTAVINAPSTFPITIVATDVVCNSGSDGSADLTTNGGTSPYNYFWSNSATTENLSGVVAGIYTVNVIDVNGCSAYDSVTVSEPSAISINLTTTDVLCDGDTNGTASTAVSGGISPYSYLWSTGNTLFQVSNLTSQTYSVTVADTNSCDTTVSFTINGPAVLTATITSSDVTCNGLCNGSATANTSGGTMPYLYLWNDPSNQTTQTATGLCPGTYNVNISDANNCQTTLSVTITEPIVLTLSISATDASCNTNSGTATATISGGTTPYSYAWSNSAIDSTSVGLATGSYSVTVTDDNNCTASGSVTIGTTADTVPICLVSVDSTSTKNIVVWEKPIVTNIDSFKIYREVAGTGYTHIASVLYDSLSRFIDTTNGCDPNTTSYRYKLSVLDICGNESNLSSYHETIYLQHNIGGGEEVNLNWDNYEGTSFGYYRILRDSTATSNWEVLDSVTNASTTFTDNSPPSAATDYVIEIVFPTLCTATKAFKNYNSSRSNISQKIGQGALTATATAMNTTQGSCDGSVTAIASGGTPPYSYQWDDSNNQTEAIATGLCTGTYSVTVTDDDGNTTTASTTVNETVGIASQISNLKPQISIYPNPNKGTFELRMKNEELRIKNYELRILNVLGEMIYHWLITNDYSPITIDIAKQSSGIYYLQVITDRGVVVRKIIIE